MPVINIKRVYEEPEKGDGFRVLVDRLWPRGIKKEALHYDLWAKDITPSPGLRTWVHQDQEGRWQEFTKKYEDELKASKVLQNFVREIQSYDTVTLLYASRDAAQNHALILKRLIEKNLRRKS